MRAAIAHHIGTSTHSSSQCGMEPLWYGNSSHAVFLLALNAFGYLLALNAVVFLPPLGSTHTYFCVCSPPSYVAFVQRKRVLTLGYYSIRIHASTLAASIMREEMDAIWKYSRHKKTWRMLDSGRRCAIMSSSPPARKIL